MGSGGPRHLQTSGASTRELDPELGSKLTAALDRLDALDQQFRISRENERNSQTVKAWGRTCRRIDEYLREVTGLLINSHQLALECGSDGGGRATKPWVEETGMAFERLFFRLEDGRVKVTSGDRTIAKGNLEDITYEWVERVVVAWAVNSVAARLKAGR